MNLIIEIGNTRAKCAVFDRERVVGRWFSEQLSEAHLKSILEDHPQIDKAILCSTRILDPKLESFIAGKVNFFVKQSPATPVPLRNLYGTPDTLGQDRLAAAVGANMLYPERNVMIADFGTALTIDIVTAAGEYLGGNISPGASTRYRALHEFTRNLPLGSLPEEVSATGKSTSQAIDSGVAMGMIFEMEGYIRYFTETFGDLMIIFTGGDANFFEKRFKSTIFANYDLVLTGLNRILNYNAIPKKNP